MKILFVTGGTGGHIYPALALADYIRKNSTDEIAFVGNDDRMEKNIVPQEGYKFYSLHMKGMCGGLVDKIKAIFLVIESIFKSKKILKEFKPDIVIGFGGYVSVPVLLAAQSMKIKTIIHEQNSVVGKSNKIISKKCDAIITCYENVAKEFDKSKTYLLGNPRSSIIEEKSDENYFDAFKFENDKPIGLIVMGSLGSESINEIMSGILKEIDNANFIYVTGSKDYKNTKEKFEYDNVKVVEYIEQIKILKYIDFIICRAGATTCAEICGAGIPSILIPSPYVAHNHQYYNAKYLCDRNAALMIEEKNLNTQNIYDKISCIVENYDEREKLSDNAKKMSFTDSCSKIYELMKKI